MDTLGTLAVALMMGAFMASVASGCMLGGLGLVGLLALGCIRRAGR